MFLLVNVIFTLTLSRVEVKVNIANKPQLLCFETLGSCGGSSELKDHLIMLQDA